jgi:hypothetical protein
MKVATGSTRGTLGLGRPFGHDLSHVPLLNLAAELLAHFVASQLDDRVMGHPTNPSVGPIQGHTDLGRLLEQAVQFLFKLLDPIVHDRTRFIEDSFPSSARRGQLNAFFLNSPIDVLRTLPRRAKAGVHP